MDRREAIRRTAWMTGAAWIIPGVLATLQSCRETEKSESWSPEQLSLNQGQLLALISDTILPETHSPSASQVDVHHFVDLLMRDVFSETESNRISDGLDQFEDYCIEKTGISYSDHGIQQRHDLLKLIDDDAYSDQPTGSFDSVFLQQYKFIKSLVITTYFTTEEGVKQNLEYLPIPGDYEGCIGVDGDTKIIVGNHM